MPVRALRLVHAAHLRLDALLSAPFAVAEDVQDLLDEATAVAFQRIVTAALEADADALILTGDTFDHSSGSLSADVTLQREFQRLDEHGFPVFITPGLLDPASAWREIPSLPENVTVFHQGDEAGVELTDRGRRLATILPVSAGVGVSAPELERLHSLASRPFDERGFTVGLWIPEAANSQTLNGAGYSSLDLLLGGEGGMTSTLPLTEGHVHLQPGPQGLNAHQTGGRGCQVIDVDADGRIRTRLVPTAPVRWETCAVDGRGVVDRDELLERLLSQLETLSGYAGEQVRIIHWSIDHEVLDSVGLHADDDLAELAATLVELTDQPKGLRYVHRIGTAWNRADFPAKVDRELWQDYVAELERWIPLETERLRKLWEQSQGVAGPPAGWPADASWPPIDSDRVQRRAFQNGQRWFRQTGAARR